MIKSKIIAIESDMEKITLVLEEKQLSRKAWDNVFNKGQSMDEQDDLEHRKFTPFFQDNLGEHLIGKIFYKTDSSEKYLTAQQAAYKAIKSK